MNYSSSKKGIHNSVFIADGVKIVGDVTIKEDANIWFNAVIRADMSYVKIGARTNIQDLACVHVNTNQPTIIEDDVTIGHSAIIHGATIKRGALIGMGAIVLDGAIVEEDALVAAGCLVPPKKVVPKGHLAVGNPMKIVKALSEQDIFNIKANKDIYLRLANNYIE